MCKKQAVSDSASYSGGSKQLQSSVSHPEPPHPLPLHQLIKLKWVRDVRLQPQMASLPATASSAAKQSASAGSAADRALAHSLQATANAAAGPSASPQSPVLAAMAWPLVRGSFTLRQHSMPGPAAKPRRSH
ncbi:TPA: hypothetical protein ACH3X3_005240 [Trebouxia sp. C0006]